MAKIISFLKFIFPTSVILLIAISLFPGSLIGMILFGDLGRQPNLIHNPFGTAINHFICYLYISLLGFFLYLRHDNFQKLILGLLILSVILELFHFIIPNRSFQFVDLFGNILGVVVALCCVKIYLFYNKS